MLATANTRKTRERVLEKMQVNGPKLTEISKGEIPGRSHSMRGYTRALELWILLNRWDLNFCVRSSPLPGTVVVVVAVSSHTRILGEDEDF